MDLSDFHPFFIDLFERHLESFPSQKIINNLALEHNTNKITQTIVSKILFLQLGLSFSLFNPSHSIMEIHPYFYDPIEIQLERAFQEKVMVNKLLTIKIHSTFIFSFLRLIIFSFFFIV